MGSRARRKFKSYNGRRAGTRQQNNVILIVCVGETERNYFKQFKSKSLTPTKHLNCGIYFILKDLRLSVIGKSISVVYQGI